MEKVYDKIGEHNTVYLVTLLQIRMAYARFSIGS